MNPIRRSLKKNCEQIDVSGIFLLLAVQRIFFQLFLGFMQWQQFLDEDVSNVNETPGIYTMRMQKIQGMIKL